MNHPLNTIIIKELKESQGWTVEEYENNILLIKKKFFLNVGLLNFASFGSTTNSVELFSEIKKKYNLSFLIFNTFNLDGKNISAMKYEIPLTLNYQHTFIIDLNREVHELKKKMNSNYRNEINKGSKLCSLNVSNEYLEQFYRVYQENVHAEGGQVYKKEYLAIMLKNENVKLFSAIKNDTNEYVGGCIIIEGEDIGYYYLGGYNRSVSGASKYLLYNAMLSAKDSGCHFFDFGGVSLSESKKMKNLFSFKKRFGGDLVDFGPTSLIASNLFLSKIAKIILYGYKKFHKGL
jgi:lipid II:glycine glycyltransferase (peptidoglycan interpeptide bridge formation enzyme)